MGKRRRKSIVRIHQEGPYYLAYFIEARKLIPVNKIGAKIIDAFFQ